MWGFTYGISPHLEHHQYSLEDNGRKIVWDVANQREKVERKIFENDQLIESEEAIFKNNSRDPLISYKKIIHGENNPTNKPAAELKNTPGTASEIKRFINQIPLPPKEEWEEYLRH